jgi:hypothetical protein
MASGQLLFQPHNNRLSSIWKIYMAKGLCQHIRSKSTIALSSLQVMRKSFLFLAIVFFIIIAEQSFTTWLPTYSKAIFNADPFVATQTTVIFAFSALAGRIIYGMLILKRSWSKLFAGLLVSIFIIISCISGILIFEKPHQIFLYLILVWAFLLVLYILLSMPTSSIVYRMNRKEEHCWDLSLFFHLWLHVQVLWLLVLL